MLKNNNVYFRSFGLLLTLSVLFCSISCSNQPVRVVAKTDKAEKTDIRRIEGEVTAGLAAITKALDIEVKKKVHVRIVEGGICCVKDGAITLPIRHVENLTAAPIHELMHILTLDTFNRFYSEGIAIYFQESYGEDNAFPNFDGVVFHDLVAEYSDNIVQLEYLIENPKVFGREGTDERKQAYIQTGSFHIYLVEKYGIAKLKELYYSRYIDYEKVYRKTIAELEAEWLKYVI